jgi:hypothetical protein
MSFASTHTPVTSNKVAAIVRHSSDNTSRYASYPRSGSAYVKLRPIAPPYADGISSVIFRQNYSIKSS